ncbi:TetR/AcrR family transcriptional regulator [Nitratireductor sp. XY-223]|uniref:TetR/AcrR family transcriptional regulator n=1 Tax=Nitratireductor sp. XY-223 TaxID=2561926 RepID=UPI0010AAD8CD|nr:TetR/AcrR family transcriptional regulator [Nitratireductor sp. XY-223]
MKIRDENICKAAIKVFMRYGIRRTTMNDIAAEAGLVRQTLYKIYPNKDAVLCAAIRFYSDQSLDAVKEGWKRAHSLADKLDVYFEHAICASFAIVRASPEAADMIGGYTPAGKAEIRRVQAQKAEAIAEILAPYGDRIRLAGLGVDDYADFIQHASIGLRDTANDEAHLRVLLASLKANILSLTGCGRLD